MKTLEEIQTVINQVCWPDANFRALIETYDEVKVTIEEPFFPRENHPYCDILFHRHTAVIHFGHRDENILESCTVEIDTPLILQLKEKRATNLWGFDFEWRTF